MTRTFRRAQACWMLERASVARAHTHVTQTQMHTDRKHLICWYSYHPPGDREEKYRCALFLSLVFSIYTCTASFQSTLPLSQELINKQFTIQMCAASLPLRQHRSLVLSSCLLASVSHNTSLSLSALPRHGTISSADVQIRTAQPQIENM